MFAERGEKSAAVEVRATIDQSCQRAKTAIG
jgi:hypothetical protein